LLKQFGFLVIMSADNDFDPGVERARSLDHLPRIEGVGRRNYEDAGASNMSLNRNRRPIYFAADGNVPAPTCPSCHARPCDQNPRGEFSRPAQCLN
jgi:hypothetical protein